MKLFHHISTESYAPISHDNNYLFNHYDRVNNFLKTKLDPKYKNILAKPVQRNYNIEWFSSIEGLQKHDNFDGDHALQEYWKFKKDLDNFVKNLNVSQDKDARNWVDLLNKVFNPDDNIIFSNGNDICLVWGWKFEENNKYTPKILDLEPKQKSVNVENDEPLSAFPVEQESEPEVKIDADPEPESDPEPEIYIDEIELFPVEDEIDEDVEFEEPKEEGKSFLQFLKEFAANYWWLLIILLVLIVLIFTYYLILSYT